MRFSIQPELFDLFPGLRIPVVVARGIENRGPHPDVESAWREAWTAADAGRVYGNAQSHPRIRPWRDRFRAMGISGKEFPCSAEALLRRALKGGEPFSINPLVDFYNSVSLRHAVPAGAFDLDGMAGDLALRLTRPGDTFQAIDAAEAIPVEAGEVAYTDDREILTRHFVWRQARTGLVQPESRSVLLLSEVLGKVGPEVAEQVLADFLGGLRTYFGVDATAAAITDASTPAIEWE
jgi:DNA/RNA-binding domain of Phe-tRNA-synthetase-like protein